MPEIEIGPETEGEHNWSYQVRVFDAGRTYEYDVTLSWPDYDLWSHGRVPPSRVVEAVFGYLLDREAASEILPRFDCSLVRRYFPDVDKQLPKLI